MEMEKYKRLYLWINIPLILIILIPLIGSFLISSRRDIIYYAGIVCRSALGVWCIFNGIWNSTNDYYSILKNNRFQRNSKTPRWAWLLLLIIGIGCLITAYAGYGFNGVKKPN